MLQSDKQFQYTIFHPLLLKNKHQTLKEIKLTVQRIILVKTLKKHNSRGIIVLKCCKLNIIRKHIRTCNVYPSLTIVVNTD